MKHITLLIMSILFLAGCAHEAPYVDYEQGMAVRDAFSQQVVHKDYAYAKEPDPGMDAIHAEPIHELYHRTFLEGFDEEDFDIHSDSD